MSKIMLAPGAARSKVYEFGVKVEASYLVRTDNEDHVLAVRLPEGRWLPIETWQRRAEALGLEVDDEWRSVKAGTHPVGT